MSTINQKEYLKKYLSIGKTPGEKKKRKKRDELVSDRLKIIDDDIDVNISDEIKVDINAENEDAPQIVAVIDDRPPSLRIDEKTMSKLWKPIGENDNNLIVENFKQPSIPEMTKDYSPPSKTVRHDDDDYSPPRKSSRKQDSSPPRKHRNSRTRETSVDDSSPPRKVSSDDYSPPRKSTKKQDLSPVRKHYDSRTRETSVDDRSPPRKVSDDYSPPRRRKTRFDSVVSPRRRENKEQRGRRNNEDVSGRSNKSVDRTPKQNRSESESNAHGSKLTQMFDGKKAGLLSASDLAEATKKLRRTEDEMFQNMSAEVSGVNAATVVRGQKTIDVEADANQKKREKENKEKYNRWGRGLKQVDDQSEKVAQELYEMSKPLARYADDEDLEKYLKEQEREGDPMLKYIRKKKQHDIVKSGAPIKPQYEGEFMPNRFGIRPGYRWDGVDRSSGYEKKWFDIQNSRRADQEESYKWSTEDM